MGSGAKTELVTIERETRTADGAGGYSASWGSIGQLWVEASFLRSSESQQRGAMREVLVYRFRGLAADIEALAIKPRDRLIWNSEAFNIREVPRRLPRAIETDIMAETGVTQ